MSTWTLLAQQDDGGGAAAMIGMLIYLVVLVVVIVGMWKLFEKAGKPGWAAIIPIYNGIVLLEIAGKPVWWILLLLIPCVSFIVWILVALDLAKNFGKSTGFGVGLGILPLIFLPILGFSDARYQGPAAQPTY